MPPDPGIHGLEELGRVLGTMVTVAENEGVVTCSVPVRNVGLGLAIVSQVWLYGPEPPRWNGVASLTVIPSGEQTTARFTLARNDPQGGPIIDQVLRARSFSVSVLYTNAAGGQETITRLDVHQTEGGGWRVTRVHLCDPEMGEAYVSSAPAL